MNRKLSFRDQLLPPALVSFFILFLTALIWLGGWPRGADSWGHLFKAEYLAELMRTQGIAAYVQAAWLPAWYMGDPFLTYYPPLTTLLLAPLAYLLGTPDLVYKAFVTFFLVAFSWSIYLYIFRYWGNWTACLGTMLAAAAPYQMRTVFFEGNYPRALALLALPFLALLTDRLLAPRRKRTVTILLLALCWAWAILAHPQQAFLFAICLLAYALLRLVLDPSVPVYRLLYWLAALFFGGLLASPWALPAYNHAELTNIPFLPVEKIPLFSAPVSGFLPAFDLWNGQILFGIGAILLGILTIASKPDPRRVSWYLAGMIGILFSLGPQGVFFSLLPLNSQLLPERFLNFSAFAIPVAAAGIFPLVRSRRFFRFLLVAGCLAVDLYPGVALLPGGPYPSTESILASAGSPSGRTALMTYPEPTSLEVYFAGQNADLINGWALENTPHHTAIRRVLSASEWGPEYLQSLFHRWDVRTVVVRGGLDAEPARAMLADAGFLLQTESAGYQVWRSPAPSARVQVIPSGSALIAGDKLSPFLGAFPYAEEVSITDFKWSQSNRLPEYTLLGLYQFGRSSTSVRAVESHLRTYAEAGGTAVVDLSGMEDVFGRTLDFLGVHVYRMSFADRIALRWDPSLEESAAELLLPAEFSRWSGATYENLDSVFATVSNGNTQFPVFGFKQIGRGKVWFVGGNLLYYAQITADEALRTAIVERILDSAELELPLLLEPVPVRDYRETDKGISFAYTLDRPVNALVSFTYSPRWNAYVDGAFVMILPRDGLIRIPLPAGDHRVEIIYNPFATVWPLLGWLFAASGFAACVVLILAERLWAPREEPRRSLMEYFQMPEGTAPGTNFSQCANCGFRLAEASPPTTATYPFQVSQCAVCGARMDDEGFLPGKQLEPAERERILTQWLRDHGYDPRTVYATWGFSLEEFFLE